MLVVARKVLVAMRLDKCKTVKYAIAEGIDSVTKECTSCDQNVDNITKDLNLNSVTIPYRMIHPHVPLVAKRVTMMI